MNVSVDGVVTIPAADGDGAAADGEATGTAGAEADAVGAADGEAAGAVLAAALGAAETLATGADVAATVPAAPCTPVGVRTELPPLHAASASETVRQIESERTDTANLRHIGS